MGDDAGGGGGGGGGGLHVCIRMCLPPKHVKKPFFQNPP